MRLLLKKQSDQGLHCQLCYSYKALVDSSHENHHFIGGQKEKGVQNFRTFTVYVLLLQPLIPSTGKFIWKEDSGKGYLDWSS